MSELTLVLIGAALVMVGWYWGGVTDRRTTAIAVGVPAALLIGTTVFSAAATRAPNPALWALGATVATWSGLMAASSHWEMMTERTTGLFSLFVILVAALATLALAKVSYALAIGAVLILIAAAFIFVSGALVPRVRGFRIFVGWLTLAAGALTTILAFAPSFGIGVHL